MGALLAALLDDAIDEITRREPAYLDRFELALPEAAAGTESDVLAHLNECGVKLSPTVPATDPVAAMLLASARDGQAAETGRLPIRPEPRCAGDFAQRFHAAYDERRTPNGIRYFAGRAGERRLLLVTAIGVPIAAWAKLLLDPSHGLRITIVETRHADLFAGGLRGPTGPDGDAADIAAALADEAGGPVDVLGWSNGARVAIELAATRSDLVCSLVLLAPTLSGIEDLPAAPSPFEEQLTKIFAAVGTNPAAAAFFSKALTESIRLRSWDDRPAGAAQRARTLLSLPAAEQAPMLIATLANGELLANFMQRYFADLDHPLRRALSSLRLPLLVVTGDHDTIVSNALTLAAMRRDAPHFRHAEVTAAGHCIQDLQYRYFRWLLEFFYGDGRRPTSAARVAVAP
jgi:pimeloyl-ACP methyl ester carboxylesterase